MATARVTFIPNPLLEAEWNRSEYAAGMLIGIGEKVKEAAQANAPVLTGALRDSIEYELSEDESGRPMVTIGTSIRYGGFVEFGTSVTPAQPYLRPALDEAV